MLIYGKNAGKSVEKDKESILTFYNVDTKKPRVTYEAITKQQQPINKNYQHYASINHTRTN